MVSIQEQYPKKFDALFDLIWEKVAFAEASQDDIRTLLEWLLDDTPRV